MLSVMLACIVGMPPSTAVMEAIETMKAARTHTYRRFTVIEEDGRVERTEPVPDRDEALPSWAANVSPDPYDWPAHAPDSAVFAAPIPFIVPPPDDSGEPFYGHSHCPDITWLPNGDLLAVWYNAEDEWSTALTVLAARLRADRDQWDPAAEFFKAENRNMHGNSVFFDRETGMLHHFNGMGREGVGGYRHLALLHRFSMDNGVTWSVARPVSTGADYRDRHQVVAGMLRTAVGALIQPCDGTSGGAGPTAIHVSRDGGLTWHDPGGDIRGIHAGVVERADGRLLALGRGQAIRGRMPVSISADDGASWDYAAGAFPPIGAGQRLTLKRLREGPLLLVSFTGQRRRGDNPWGNGMTFDHADGGTYEGYGLFAALSFDDGESWPVRRLLTPGQGVYPGLGGDGGRIPGTPWEATPRHAEPAGYLAATQTPDGIIHLVSSRLYYRFNLQWLTQP